MDYPFLKSEIEKNEQVSLKNLSKPAIVEIQQILVSGGYLKGDADGIAGKMTLDAFAKFKRDNFLEFPELLGASTAQELLDLAGVSHPIDEDSKTPAPGILANETLGSKSGNTMRLPNGEIVYANQLIKEGVPLTWGELTKNCTRVPVSKEIVANLHIIAAEFGEIRSKAGVPIAINSGYRDPATNRAIGGARFSQHMSGLAIDISPAPGTISLNKLWEIARGVAKTGGLGDGRYRGFIHRDRRPNSNVVCFGY